MVFADAARATEEGVPAGLPRLLRAHPHCAVYIFRALIGGRERNGARVIGEAFEQHLDGVLIAASEGIDGTLSELLVKRFVVSALLGVAAHALNDGGKTTAEEMQRLFQKLVGSGLSA